MAGKLLMLLSFIFFTRVLFAQNSLAKIKYEEAEEAYQKGNYQLTLTKLDETEALLKTLAPNILHLRILASCGILKQSPYSDYNFFETTKKNAEFYLKTYENTVIEKYKDVYQASEWLISIAKNKEEFERKKAEVLAQKQKQEEEKARIAFEQKRKENEQRLLAEKEEKKKAEERERQRVKETATVIGYVGGKFAPLGFTFYRLNYNHVGLYASFRGLIRKDPSLFENKSYRLYTFSAGITANILYPFAWYGAAGISHYRSQNLKEPQYANVNMWERLAGLDVSTGLLIHIKKVKLQAGIATFNFGRTPLEFCFGIGYNIR
jgi:hypothetical protein